MKKPWIDFKSIKAAISMEMVLDHYGVQLRRVNPHYLRGPCPLPTHGSAASKQSFGVDTVKNVWSCQSKSCVAASGRRGGNVLDFVAAAESCTIREAAEKLQTWFGVGVQTKEETHPPAKVAPTKPQASVAESEEGSGENKRLGFTLKGVDIEHPYLASRGISKETAAYFGVGLFGGRGSMHGRAVIPIHNEKGELLAYAGRAVDGTEPKYKFPTGFRKSQVLFNLHRVLALPESRKVILVEGFFDAMKVHQAGYASVVALMGSSLSDKQAELLVTHCKALVLFLDGDGAGEDATARIAARLVRSMYVKIVVTPSGRQPDQLSADEIRLLVGSL